LNNQYEKIIDKEKLDAADRINLITDNNKKLKEDNYDLSSKNSYLNSKLQECQSELMHIQNEIKNTFEVEEDKQNKLYSRISELERNVREKENFLEKNGRRHEKD